MTADFTPVELTPAEAGRVRLKLAGGHARPTDIDRAQMAVTGVICAAVRDRDGDILEPGGADTTRHRANPIVFLNHGIVGGIPGMALPVGRAMDPGGNYSVRYDKASDLLLARTYFDQNSATAAEVFRLFDDDILRGFSIGFLPVRVKKVLDKLPGRQRAGYHIDRWELLEYSAVCVPSNPAALRVKLQKGFGPNVSPMLKSVLEPLAAEPAAWSPGWSPAPASQPTTFTFRKGIKMSATAAAAPKVECHAILFPPAEYTVVQAKEWLAKGFYTPENDYPLRDPVATEHAAYGGDNKCLAYFRTQPDQVDPASITVIDLADGVKGVYAALKPVAPGTPETPVVTKAADAAGTAGSHQPGKEAASEASKAPFGAQVLGNLLEHIAEHVGQVEHPKTKKVLLQAAKKFLACCKECYPDIKAAAIPGLEDEKDDDDAPAGTGMKAVLPPGKVMVDADALVKLTQNIKGVQEEFFRATGRDLRLID